MLCDTNVILFNTVKLFISLISHSRTAIMGIIDANFITLIYLLQRKMTGFARLTFVKAILA